ncbi:hypothetical protein [uncultured Tolumonas sp.]|uniref:hypothetical protein n=1 Tax=uncultured Tolumonas sp. TaxID=263765 RepID=UPI0029316A93|nr:hypothetical protein [uncultured Tolumonas sp.]
MAELAFVEIEFNANLAVPRSAGSGAENFDKLSMPAKNKTHNQQNQLTSFYAVARSAIRH